MLQYLIQPITLLELSTQGEQLLTIVTICLWHVWSYCSVIAGHQTFLLFLVAAWPFWSATQLELVLPVVLFLKLICTRATTNVQQLLFEGHEIALYDHMRCFPRYQGLPVLTRLSTDKPKCNEWRRSWLCSAKLLLFIEQCVQNIPFVDSCLLPLLCYVA